MMEAFLLYWSWTLVYFSCREVLDEYGANVKIIMDVLFKAMAMSLNLEENSFSSQFGERAVMQRRFNFYLSCPRPDLVLGFKPHSDGSGITVLLQNKEVEGLQVFKDDKWFRVPIIPHALVVNLGDQMQVSISLSIWHGPKNYSTWEGFSWPCLTNIYSNYWIKNKTETRNILWFTAKFRKYIIAERQIFLKPICTSNLSPK